MSHFAEVPAPKKEKKKRKTSKKRSSKSPDKLGSSGDGDGAAAPKRSAAELEAEGKGIMNIPSVGGEQHGEVDHSDEEDEGREKQEGWDSMAVSVDIELHFSG